MAALFLCAAVTASCAREPAPRPDAEVIVAQVNGTSVSLRDLKAEIASLRGFSKDLSSQVATRAEVSEAMRRLVEKAIVLEEGERRGVTVSSSELEEEIRRIRADFPPGGLEKALLEQGLDFDTWRAELRKSLLFRKSAAAIASGAAHVRPEEVEKEFRRRGKGMSRPERIHLRQLLFATGEQAGRARELLLAGMEPEEAARRAAGGEPLPPVADLGFVTREELPEDLAGELFALSPGEVSRVIRRDESFLLFQMLGRQPARPAALAEEGPRIREEILRARREAALRAFVASRVAGAHVRVRQELLDGLTGGGR